MKIQYFKPEQDGFYGTYYPCTDYSDSVFLYMLGTGSPQLPGTADPFLIFPVRTDIQNTGKNYGKNRKQVEMP